MGSPDQVDAKASIDPEIVEILVRRFGVENLEYFARALDRMSQDSGFGHITTFITHGKATRFELTTSVKPDSSKLFNKENG